MKLQNYRVDVMKKKNPVTDWEKTDYKKVTFVYIKT